MAKVSFSKLGLTKNNNIKTIEYNGQIIEVKQYLPMNDKAIIASNVLNYSFGDGSARFINPMQVEVCTIIFAIQAYTNINFTEKQKEDIVKLYDLIMGSGLWALIFNEINKEDYGHLLNYIDKSINSFYNYFNSAYGVLDSIKNQYESMNLDATEIYNKLADPNNMTLLKDVVTKLG
jgi:hypothetical protein